MIGRVGSAARTAATSARDEVGRQPPRVLHAERVDRLVLDLPGDDRGAALYRSTMRARNSVAASEQAGMRGRLDERALGQRGAEVMRRHEELRIAERLHRARTDDDPLAGPLRRSICRSSSRGQKRPGAGSMRVQ